MRTLFSTDEFFARGGTRSQLHWGLRTQKYVRAAHGVHLDGPAPPTRLEVAVGRVYGTNRPARGLDAAVMHGLDGTPWKLPGLRRVRAPMLAGEAVRLHGVWCASGLQTVIDVAPMLSDAAWEMANESALHKKLYCLHDLNAMLPLLSAGRVAGTSRIRRVLALRPPGAPPTESALETLMVQLIRTRPDIPLPTRQFVLFDEHGTFVARIDLAWPELGVFVELDGEAHKGQPVYDASRESAIVAATGWLCGRFTWTEVRRHPAHTVRRLARIIDQARRRPARLVTPNAR